MDGGTAQLPDWMTVRPDGDIVIAARIQPGSSRFQIVVADEGSELRIRLMAPPVDGKANAELIKKLAKRLGVAKSNIQIENGVRGRSKRLRVRGVTALDAVQLLDE